MLETSKCPAIALPSKTRPLTSLREMEIPGNLCTSALSLVVEEGYLCTSALSLVVAGCTKTSAKQANLNRHLNIVHLVFVHLVQPASLPHRSTTSKNTLKRQTPKLRNLGILGVLVFIHSSGELLDGEPGLVRPRRSGRRGRRAARARLSRGAGMALRAEATALASFVRLQRPLPALSR